MATLLVAATVLVLLAVRPELPALPSFSRTPTTPSTQATAEAPAAPAGNLVRAALTTNVFALPDRSSEVVAIIPGQRDASAEGVSASGEWMLVAYPAGSTVRGWVRASGMSAPVASVPVVGDGVATAAGTPVPATAVPDAALADVFLLEGKHLTISIRNIGQAPITDATMTLSVSRLEGELVSVLRIGPTTLAPGASATVVTPLDIEQPGSYRISLDPGREVSDAQSANNVRQALLVPNKG